MTNYTYTDDCADTLTITGEVHFKDGTPYASVAADSVEVPKAEAVRAAAALLRAAGWGKAVPPEEVGNPERAEENSTNGALAYLDAVIAHQDAQKAKLEDKQALNREARALYETGCKSAGVPRQHIAWSRETAANVAHWETIAKAARGLHGKVTA